MCAHKMSPIVGSGYKCKNFGQHTLTYKHSQKIFAIPCKELIEPVMFSTKIKTFPTAISKVQCAECLVP